MSLRAKFNATADRQEQAASNVVTLSTPAAETADRAKLRRMAGQLGKRFGQNKPGE